MSEESSRVCDCDDYKLSRRRLLSGIAASGAAALGGTLIGDVFTQVAYGAVDRTSSVLVVLSLRGGADGLSIVVPHGDPAYGPARPSIAVPTSQLISRDSLFGLHPALAPLQAMWHRGEFGAVHAVGLPAANRSHFAAMDEIEDADPGSPERRGWLNRVVGILEGTRPEQGVQLGAGFVPTSLYGPAPTLSVSNLARLSLIGEGGYWGPYIRRSLEQAWRNVPGATGRGARTALAVSERLKHLTAPEPPANGAQYPTGDLATSLAEAARLIRAEVGARVVALDTGGWDMHTGLGTVGVGSMRLQLDVLARALTAFFQDLGTISQRVTVVTITEFGRRVAENGTAGLDHGYGTCMLALGAGIKGGQVRASWPGLSSGNLVDGDLQVTTDFRSVLSEILRARFPELDVSRVFPGFSPTLIGIA